MILKAVTTMGRATTKRSEPHNFAAKGRYLDTPLLAPGFANAVFRPEKSTHLR